MNDFSLNSGTAHFVIAGVATFIGLFILIPLLFALARLFGLYTIVEERRC